MLEKIEERTNLGIILIDPFLLKIFVTVMVWVLYTDYPAKNLAYQMELLGQLLSRNYVVEIFRGETSPPTLIVHYLLDIIYGL